MNQKKVQVLMSTYNGEKYLEEQIQSIINQTWNNLDILIRDDGSKDKTCEILKSFEKKYPNIHVLYGDNKGSNASFFELLLRSDADYISFSDQDDYWLPNKIENAIKCIESDSYLLYCGNKRVVDSNLKELPGNIYPKLQPCFGGAVIESICTGCTMLLSRELTEIVKKNIPTNAIVHDWWIYLVATYFGKVYFDDNAYILYRQHEMNQIGADNNFIATLIRKKEYVLKNRGRLKKQLEEFREYYQSDIKKDELINALLSTEKNMLIRIKMSMAKSLKRQSFIDRIAVAFLILSNKLL